VSTTLSVSAAVDWTNEETAPPKFPSEAFEPVSAVPSAVGPAPSAPSPPLSLASTVAPLPTDASGTDPRSATPTPEREAASTRRQTTDVIPARILFGYPTPTYKPRASFVPFRDSKRCIRPSTRSLSAS